MNWIDFVISDLEQTTHCKICLQCVATKSGNTASLFQHLKQRPSVQSNVSVYEMLKLAAANKIPAAMFYKHLCLIALCVQANFQGTFLK